jgi:hypothetical protein
MMFSTDDGTVNEGHAAGQLQSRKTFSIIIMKEFIPLYENFLIFGTVYVVQVTAESSFYRMKTF